MPFSSRCMRQRITRETVASCDIIAISCGTERDDGRNVRRTRVLSCVIASVDGRSHSFTVKFCRARLPPPVRPVPAYNIIIIYSTVCGYRQTILLSLLSLWSCSTRPCRETVIKFSLINTPYVPEIRNPNHPIVFTACPPPRTSNPRLRADPPVLDISRATSNEIKPVRAHTLPTKQYYNNKRPKFPRVGTSTSGFFFTVRILRATGITNCLLITKVRILSDDYPLRTTLRARLLRSSRYTTEAKRKQTNKKNTYLLHSDRLDQVLVL